MPTAIRAKGMSMFKRRKGAFCVKSLNLSKLGMKGNYGGSGKKPSGESFIHWSLWWKEHRMEGC